MSSPTVAVPERRRAHTAPETADWQSQGGWHVVRGGGLVAHRGVLTDDEWRWLDREAVLAEVEELLGFTREEVRTAYQRGRPSKARRRLRDRMDLRFLDVANSGGNLELLAGVLGVDRKTIGKAMTRARRTRGERAGKINGRRPRDLKRALVRRDGSRCHYCGADAKLCDLTLDHRVPRAPALELVSE